MPFLLRKQRRINVPVAMTIPNVTPIALAASAQNEITESDFGRLHHFSVGPRFIST